MTTHTFRSRPGSAGRMEVSASPFGGGLFAALDRPARTSLALAARPIWLPAPALAGLGLLAVAAAAAAALEPAILGALAGTESRTFRAGLEALLVALPPAVAFALYARLRMPFGALLGALSLGLLAAGLTAVSLVPLLAFFTLVANPLGGVPVPPTLLIVVAGLGALVAISTRVVLTLDDSFRARALLVILSGLIAGTLALRAGADLSGLARRAVAEGREGVVNLSTSEPASAGRKDC